MARDTVRLAMPRQAAEHDREVLVDVLREAWDERGRHPLGSPERRHVHGVIHDLVEWLRRLPGSRRRGRHP